MENVEATLDLLDGQEMHRRTLWLAVPLQTETAGLQVSASLGAAWAELSPMLGMRAAPVARREVADYSEQAARVEAALAGGIAFRPARPAEIVWMVQHALHRGLGEPLLAEAETATCTAGACVAGSCAPPATPTSGRSACTKAASTPASTTSTSSRARAGSRGRAAGLVAAGRRLAAAAALAAGRVRAGVGYQAHLALAECPPAVSQDAADLLAQLEGLDFPGRLHRRPQVVPAERARDQVRRKKNELIDQADQYDARPTGMPASLPEAAGDLGELDARLSRTSVEVEVQSVTVLTVWGPTAAVCDARARALAALLGGATTGRCARPACRRPCSRWACPAPCARGRCGSSPSTSSPRTGRWAGRSRTPRSGTRTGCCSASTWTAAPSAPS